MITVLSTRRQIGEFGSDLPLIGPSAVQSVRVALDFLSETDNAAWEQRINRLLARCGCSVAGLAGIGAAALAVLHDLQISGRTLALVWHALLATVVTALSIKSLVVLGSRVRLRALCRQLQSADWP